MRTRYNRKTTPRVVRGKVQRKNRWEPTTRYAPVAPGVPAVIRERPGFGYRHLLRKRDIQAFIGLLPDWGELAKGLNAIVLAPGGWSWDGRYGSTYVAVCAWERELFREISSDGYHGHAEILRKLGVPYEPTDSGYYLCKYTEATARAYQLLHILLHELGHHHDRMTTRSKFEASRGEGYAERYAREYEQLIWDRYADTFGFE